MKMRLGRLVGTLAVIAGFGATQAQLIENFDDPLGQWVSGWLYTNSNLANYYYAIGASNDQNFRGNNPTGLWIADSQGFNSGVGGTTSTIVFNSGFAANLTSFTFGLEDFSVLSITFRDAGGSVLGVHTSDGSPSGWNHTETVTMSSTTGIGSIEFYNIQGNVEGYTSIDRVVATTSPVPEPFTMGLAGLALAAAARRRLRKSA